MARFDDVGFHFHGALEDRLLNFRESDLYLNSFPMRLRYLFFAFLAAFVARADITISIDQPWDGRVADEVSVAARVGSTLEVKSVIAEVGDRRGELVYSHMGPGQQPVFVGTVSLANLARGSYQLKVTATDIANSSNSAVRAIFLNRPPTLRINGLTNNAVIRNPIVPVDIGCEDDDGCRVEIFGPFSTAIPYTNGVLNLTAYDHSSVTLRIAAIETSEGGSVQETRVVNVESSSMLRAEDGAPGEILDFDEQRILYVENGTLGILDRATRATTIITNFVRSALLTTPGAAYVRQPGNVTTAEVGEYPGGSLGSINSTGSLRAKGAYMLWSVGTILYRRNVVTDQTDVISRDAGNWYNDLTAEGDVAWWEGEPRNIFLNDRLMSTASNVVNNVYPLTDGTNVVWRRQDATNYYVVLNDGNGEEILSRFLWATWPPGHEPSSGRDYQVAGGWVAYTDLGNAGQLHVWRRSPEGQKSRLSFFGSSSTIYALNDRGEVFWANGGQFYLNERSLGNFLGQPIFKDGQWHVVIGSGLFLLDTEEPDPEVPLSIQASGDSVVISGTGMLEGSTNLTDWVEVGPVEGTMRIPRESAGRSRFYRLKL